MSLRKSMFQGVIAAGLAVTGFSSAHAQTAGSWQGFYAGAQVGYGWSNGNISDSIAFTPVESASISATGAVGGVFGGYNMQIDRFVVGFEADFGLSGLKSSQTLTLIPMSYNQSVGWTGSLRPRAGFLVTPELLLYGTAGLAVADIKENYSVADLPAYSTNQARVGWTGGAGAEYKIQENWNLRLEYRYTDYGPATNVTNNLAVVLLKSSATSNTFQVGASYKF